MWRLLIENIARYTAETAALILVGAAVGWLLRSRDARLQLLHWQILLAVCVLLPAAGRWNTPVVYTGDESIAVVQHSIAVAPSSSTFSLDSWKCAAALALLGTLVMLLRLAAGAWRLYGYRRRASLLHPQPAGMAEVRISSEVSGPVSYGLLSPVILLPSSFESWTDEAKRCVLAHEMAHVRRNDWLFGVVEEFIRALLWFHPGVWLVINRIHLSREQVVDAETLCLTGNREAYLDTLLSVAGLKERLGFVPAPLFVRKRHLASRVAHLVVEVRPMNKFRMLFSLAAGALTLAGAGAVLTTLFPFEAPAQEVQLESQAQGASVLHKVSPKYPPAAKLRHVEGTVSFEVNIDANGLVTDARVLSGPEELRRAATQAVLQWQFTATGAANRGTADITFRLPKDAAGAVGVLNGIDLAGLPDDMRLKVAGRIPLKVGDAIPADGLKEFRAAVSELDSRIRLTMGEDMILHASMAPMSIRVGGNAQAIKLVKQIRPAYPPEAKQQRIQGTVRMTARIDKTGKVVDLQLEAGDPLLAPSALEAVKQWEYQPTLLNGEPVEVITMVDVNYTLSK